MTMKEQMEAELQEMIRTLEKANGALARIFNVEERCSTCHKVKDQFSKEWEYAQCETCSMEDEMAACTRCGQEVESESLVSYGDWKLCELCQGDI